MSPRCLSGFVEAYRDVEYFLASDPHLHPECPDGVVRAQCTSQNEGNVAETWPFQLDGVVGSRST